MTVVPEYDLELGSSSRRRVQNKNNDIITAADQPYDSSTIIDDDDDVHKKNCNIEYQEGHNNDDGIDDIEQQRNKQSNQSTTPTSEASIPSSSSSLVGENNKMMTDDEFSCKEQQFEHQKKKIGDKFSTDEFTFVLSAGILLAFNAGYVNGSCLSGLLTPSGIKQSVAGFTGSYTISAMALAANDWNPFGFQLTMILCFIFGCTITGFITPNPTPYRLEPTYGPTFFIGAVFLTTASLLVIACDSDHLECTFQRSPFYFAAAANGIQNGISSLYSANLVRSTHLTGTSTDIGLFIGQILRGNRQHVWKLIVLICLALAFWIGGLVSFYATTQFHHLSLLFNAGLYILIGIGFVIFIVKERHISILAAITGRWKWKSIFDQLSKTSKDQQEEPATGIQCDGGSSSKRSTKRNSPMSMMGKQQSSKLLLESQHFGEFFDTLEGVDEHGELAVDDLCIELNKVGVQLSKKDAIVLMKHADVDKNGKLSRNEWIDIATKSTAVGGGTTFSKMFSSNSNSDPSSSSSSTSTSKTRQQK